MTAISAHLSVQQQPVVCHPPIWQSNNLKGWPTVWCLAVSRYNIIFFTVINRRRDQPRVADRNTGTFIRRLLFD
jgi:hypothetical protein